jgi:amino acid transporter
MSETTTPAGGSSDATVIPAAGEFGGAHTTLRRGALGLTGAVVISVAVMSPAASIFFNTKNQAQAVGAAIPFCFVVGFIVALLAANQYSEFSRELPSSGSAYTFVREGLGARFGFLTGWIGLIAIVLGVPYTFVFMSAYLQTLVDGWFGVDLHWTIYYVAAVGIVFAISYIGIRQSLRVDLTLLVFEIGVCLTLAALVLFKVGSNGGLSLAPFSPASVPPGGILAVGIVFAILSFIGFETAAALGEETRNPRRNIPRAVYGSMIVVGLFYIVMVYAATMGYGIDKMVSGYGNDFKPFDTIARAYSGNTLAVLIDIVGILSFFSAALAIVNGGARIIYTLGRDGLLPRPLAWTHPTRQTPGGAITLLCGLGLVAGIPLGLAFTPGDAFGFLGILDALFILLIYFLVSAACIRFFWRLRRGEFKFVRHGVIPAMEMLITGGIVLLVLFTPGDSPSSVYIPYVVGAWLLIGIPLALIVGGKAVAVEQATEAHPS